MMRLLWRQISPQDGHSLCFIQQSFHLILPQDYNPLSRNCGCIYLPSPPAQWSTHRNDSRNNKVYNQYHGLGCPDSFLWKRKKEGGVEGGRETNTKEVLRIVIAHYGNIFQVSLLDIYASTYWICFQAASGHTLGYRHHSEYGSCFS